MKMRKHTFECTKVVNDVARLTPTGNHIPEAWLEIRANLLGTGSFEAGHFYEVTVREVPPPAGPAVQPREDATI